MAADTNEKSASEKEKSAAHVGSGGQVKRPLKFDAPHVDKKNVGYALLVVVGVVLLGILLHTVFHVGDKVYAQAAGHKIYKSDIDDLVGKTKGVSDHDAATVLANKYLYEAMAKKGDVKVTDQNIEAQYPGAAKQKTSDPFIYQKNVNNVYFNNLLAYNKGLYKGDVLVANFSRNIAFQSPFIGIQQATNPTLGNPAAVAADKAYAYAFITKLYNQIKSGKITFDQAIQTEHNDPVVGEQAYGTLPHSGPFNTSNVYLPGSYLVSAPSIQPRLASMKAGQLSAPFAVRVPNSWYNKNVTTDSYYLVVRMDSTQGSHSGLTFSKYLEQAKKQYGYKVNS